MHSRRHHKKSRKGCRGCKERRIKCDESGPPCANCAVRKQKCEYGYFREQPTVLGASGLPVGADGRGGSDWQLLELELIHHYTTQTWKCFKSVPNDTYLQQTVLPRIGLTKHRFLLNGILAVAALDMARLKRKEREQPPQERGGAGAGMGGGDQDGIDDIPKTHRTEQEYLRASRLFYTAGSEGFRAELSRGPITADNAPAIYFFSFGAAIFNLAMRIPRRSPTAHRAACFALAESSGTGSGSSSSTSSTHQSQQAATMRSGQQQKDDNYEIDGYCEGDVVMLGGGGGDGGVDGRDPSSLQNNNNNPNEAQEEEEEEEEEEQEEDSNPILSRIDLLFNLLLGTGTVQAISYDLLRHNKEIWPEEGMASVPSSSQADSLLDQGTKTAFERLWQLRSSVLRVELDDDPAAPNGGPPPAPIEQDLEEIKTVLEWEEFVSENLRGRQEFTDANRMMDINTDRDGREARRRRGLMIRGTRWRRFRVAILVLERFFAEDSRGTTQGMALAWPWACGPVLVEDVRTREPFALLLLCHWAVLMWRMEANVENGRRYWWAEGVGRRCVGEASRILVAKRGEWTGACGTSDGDDVVVVPEEDRDMVEDLWVQSIDWTRRQVGLDPL